MIDTHCHVDLFTDPLSVARNAESKGITTIAVTYLPSHFVIAQQQLIEFKHVRPALGLHPLATANDHERELSLFCSLAVSANLIGEIGLDFSASGKATRTTQERSFEIILDVLRSADRFISLHSRAAEKAVLARLAQARVQPVVFHWFSGSRQELVQVLDAGHLISINPAMIRAPKWRELIALVPKTQVLTESDGPFVKCKGHPCSPQDISQVLTWLATFWDESVESVETQIRFNFARASRQSGSQQTNKPA
jgi:TatD DNase family protein